jgi:hypothetical protein
VVSLTGEDDLVDDIAAFNKLNMSFLLPASGDGLEYEALARVMIGM